MDASSDRGDGFTVLDGVALVVAAAVASVHMRGPVQLAAGAVWGLVWIAFGGVALTAAGPILFLIRRYGRRSEGYPRIGDRLWALLGTPWLLTAPLRSGPGGAVSRSLGLYSTILTITVGAASVLVLAVLWKVWVLTPPGARDFKNDPAPWTARMGMALSVAWPLQCGFLLVVLDSETFPGAR
ncbi:MAG: hypothetical protein JWN86_2112 [Planctomycetota bacterium]|nr:hypothetical protein [Planctomycetota bacterium]